MACCSLVESDRIVDVVEGGLLTVERKGGSALPNVGRCRRTGPAGGCPLSVGGDVRRRVFHLNVLLHVLTLGQCAIKIHLFIMAHVQWISRLLDVSTDIIFFLFSHICPIERIFLFLVNLTKYLLASGQTRKIAIRRVRGRLFRGPAHLILRNIVRLARAVLLFLINRMIFQSK